jgi:hypothetical protein
MKKIHERLITLAGVATLVGIFIYMYWPDIFSSHG